VGSPATYALAGMGAFFSVVSKVPITIVIVFEMTRLQSGAADDWLCNSLFGCRKQLRSMVRWVNGIYLEKKLRLRDFGRVDSKDVMQPRVETLGVQMTLDEAVQAFPSHHRGFPVVDNSRWVLSPRQI